jgi:hypothetical protein
VQREYRQCHYRQYGSTTRRSFCCDAAAPRTPPFLVTDTTKRWLPMQEDRAVSPGALGLDCGVRHGRSQIRTKRTQHDGGNSISFASYGS